MLTDEVWIVAALRISKGKGNGAVVPSLGGYGAAFVGGAGTDGAGARGGEVVTPFVAVPACDAPASTHVGVLRHAALRRSTRA